MNSTSNQHRPSHRFILTFFAALAIGIVLSVWSPVVYGQDYTLPLYRLTIDDQDLARLLEDPRSPNAYPGEIEYQGQSYSCSVRFRGVSAIALPKPSWKFDFDGDSPLPYPSINLDAEYRDLSISRDFFADQLAIDAGMTVPQTRHVSLIVNNRYYGVYLETEPVDKSFFERRNRSVSALYFTTDHPARYAPITMMRAFTTVYAVEEREPSGYDSLACAINWIYHSSIERFAAEAERRLDVEAFLHLFALQFVIANNDGFTKNQHIARLADGRLTVIPWDCDATFGNIWTGEWVDLSEVMRYLPMERNVILNRLVRVPRYRNRLRELIHSMGGEGLTRLDRVITDEIELIRHDVYLDTMKRGANELLGQEETKLHYYLAERRSFLRNLGDRFAPVPHLSWRVEPDYLSDPADSILFSLEFADRPYSAAVEIHDQTGQIAVFGLVDNGSLGDEVAGDGFYSAKKSFGNLTPPLHFFFRVADDSGGSYPYPWGGFADGQVSLFDIPAVRLDANPPTEGEVGFSPMEEILESSTRSVGLINRSGRALNFSDCSVAMDDVRQCRLPELPPLEPGDTLFVTNHLELSQMSYPSRRWTGGYFFAPQARDSIYLESPGSRRLASAFLVRPVRLPDTPSRVVINEINYNSSPDFDCGDWIELASLEDEVDLSGWTIRDGAANSYTIPHGTTIRRGEYLVVAADTAKFADAWPGVAFIGGLAFSFNNSGDDVTLFDSDGDPVDWVAYDDQGLWPDEADGEGATLELINPERSNYGSYYWEASSFPAVHGTPGRINQAYQSVTVEPPQAPSGWQILSLSPNPFNGALRVQLQAQIPGRVKLGLYDLTGRKTSEMTTQVNRAGYISLNWSDNRLSLAPAGIYFVRIEAPVVSASTTIILLK